LLRDKAERNSMPKDALPGYTLPAAVVSAVNPHPERHAGIVRWNGVLVDVPLRFNWAWGHSATTIRPGCYRKWDEAVALIYKFGLIAASAPIGGWLGAAVRIGIGALPNDMGQNAAPHSRMVVPELPLGSTATKPLSITIKTLKAGVDAVKSKLEDCIEQNRRAGPARGNIERANEAAMEELCAAYKVASNLLKWAGLVPLAIEYFKRPSGANAFSLMSQVAAVTLARIESVALAAIAQNETALALLSKRALNSAMKDQEWLGTIASVAKAGTFIVQVADLFYELYNVRDASASETVLELTFEAVAFDKYNSFIESRFQAGNVNWYLQLYGFSSAAEAEAYFAVMYRKVELRLAPLLKSPSGIAKIWYEVLRPGGFMDYSLLWQETTNLDASTRPSHHFPGAIDVDLE
jgi:hypothetical protein